MNIDEITLEDIREHRPDLYQEIAKEVLAASQLISDDEIDDLIKPLVMLGKRKQTQNLIH